MQYEQGKEVASRDELSPGDLVFFQTYRKGRHVGMPSEFPVINREVRPGSLS